MLAVRSKTFPLPSSQGLEVDFLENRPSDFQKPGSACVFDANRQQFTPKDNVERFKDTIFQNDTSRGNQIQLKHTQDSLQAAIQTLKDKKGKKNDEIAAFNLSEARTWGDVVTAVQAAEETYLKDDSPTGKIRKAFRKVEDNAKSMQPFLGMLPEGEYKTLCGGLTLILKGMMKKAERRQKMAELLERLPMAVQNAEDYAHIYPGRNTLRSCIGELYIQIVGAIEDMIRWYLQKSPKRGLKAVFTNDAYGDKLTKRISDIDAAQAVFKAEAEIYLHWRARLIEHHVVETNLTTQEISLDLKRLGNTLWVEIQKAQVEIQKSQREIAVVGSQVMNNVSGVLQDLQKNAKWLQERDKCKQKLVDQATRIEDLERQLQKKSFRASTLAHRLHISLSSQGHITDLEISLAAGITQSTRFQAKSKYITETEEFREWFTAEEGGMLCVNGNSEQDSLSPTAFLTSLIVQNMKPKSEEILVLSFFCGLHTTVFEQGEHRIGGPTLLLRTIITQILSLDDIDAKQYLSFLGEDEVQAMESMQTKPYLETLGELLANLLQDYKGIFIIIDGIEFYDKEEYKGRLKRMIKFLAKLTTETSSTNGTLKVLIMASSHSSLFRRSSGFDALEIPEEIECDGEGYESL
ncbi:hypothetical protein N0V90_009895 [Kalmusia sp. IMI 367209]|nr:hypothetical protein N0V90_009895 [Kalmusia sp. IMI 367209]